MPQVHVTSDRGFLKGMVGIVEEKNGDLYGVRFAPPYHEVLFWFEIREIARTTWQHL